MKKYLFISLATVSLSVFLVIHLYRTKEIPWIDELVEGSAEVLGIKPQMIREKIERRMVRQVMPLDSALVMQIVPPVDSLATSTQDTATAIDQTPPSVISPSKLPAIKPVAVAEIPSEKDSVQGAVAVVIPPPPVESVNKPRKKLFNSEETSSPPPTAEKTQANEIQYFAAVVHGAQRFAHNGELNFRIVSDLLIGDHKIPQNYVFQAKADVFEERVRFKVKTIDGVPVRAENFGHAGSPGMDLTPDMKKGKEYYISGEKPVTFGIDL